TRMKSGARSFENDSLLIRRLCEPSVEGLSNTPRARGCERGSNLLPKLDTQCRNHYSVTHQLAVIAARTGAGKAFCVHMYATSRNNQTGSFGSDTSSRENQEYRP